MENLYNILGVSPTATAEEIKKAYRTLAMRFHPDRNKHATAQSRFNAINAAYELLSDPKKRSAYNESLNNRIVIDPHKEALSLWSTLFNDCGMHLQSNDTHPLKVTPHEKNPS